MTKESMYNRHTASLRAAGSLSTCQLVWSAISLLLTSAKPAKIVSISLQLVWSVEVS